ncbi:MAG TPA: glycosyl transferase family 2 [Firmicutes bacterium]|jgi:glycosyltransferase involved in cell wall biosynthesis|nr:glycosyl transferase family 2 [Bacillota bacterium]HBK59395.1 glycosyl transferase family 2 [Bacillota bacterium]
MRVSAIVPAYNEGPRIAAVLDVVRQSRMVDEILVVDDGSDDDTAKVAAAHGAHVVRMDRNCGKGGAVARGIQSTPADVLLFLDADLVGLTVKHVENLLDPVLSDQADMTVGIFGDGRPATDLAQAITPWLSGQRAMRRSAFDGLDLGESGFGIEALLTRHAKEVGMRVVEVKLAQLTQVMKEEKLGPVKGAASRVKMYWDVLKTVVHWD